MTNAREERLAVSLPAPLSVTVSNFYAGVMRPVSAGREGLGNQNNRKKKKTRIQQKTSYIIKKQSMAINVVP